MARYVTHHGEAGLIYVQRQELPEWSFDQAVPADADDGDRRGAVLSIGVRSDVERAGAVALPQR